MTTNEESIEQVIVDAVLPNAPQQTKDIVVNLLNHAISHPWMDDDLKECIIDNICAQYKIEIPERES